MGRNYLNPKPTMPKYKHFILFVYENGSVIEKEASSENAMTLSQAMKHFKVNGIRGIE